jgi:acetyl esterase/lipase
MALGKRLLAVFLLSQFTLAANPAAAQQPAPPPVEAFFKYPAVGGAALSPNGERLAMTVRDKSGRMGLATCSVEDLKSCTFVIGTDDSDVRDFHWINNQRLVFRMGDVQEQDIRLDGTWFAANSDGTELLPLIDNKRFIASVGSVVKNHILDYTYGFLSVTHDGSDDIIVGHGTYTHTDYSLQNLQPMRLNTKTRVLVPYDFHNPAESKGWVFDQNDEPRIMTAYGGQKRTWYFRNAGSNDWTSIGPFDTEEDKGSIPQAIGFDDTIYANAATNGEMSLYRFDSKAHSLESKPLVQLTGFDYTGSLVFDRQAKKLLGVHYETDAQGAVWFDPHMKAAQSKIDQMLPSTNNRISCSSCLSQKFWLVVARSDQQPPTFLLYDTTKEALVRVGASYPDIHAAQMGRRDFYRFKARDGLDIPVYVTTPPGPKTGPRPTVVLVHGGPWVRGGHWEWNGAAQFLATRGYVVVEPEFRSSTGYGDKLYRAGYKQRGLAMQDDVADAAKWAIQQGYSDPKRIAIAGASYGGYATLMGLIKNPELFRCGFEWVGVTDIGMMFSVAWNDMTLDAMNTSLRVRIGDPDADAKQFAETSPIQNAAKLHQPLFMAYGVNDRRVPIVQGVAFRDAVEASNKNIEFISYQDEGHGWSHEGDNIDFWTRVEKFLNTNLMITPSS